MLQVMSITDSLKIAPQKTAFFHKWAYMEKYSSAAIEYVYE